MIATCRLCCSTEISLYYTEGNLDQFRYYRCRKCHLINYDLSGGLDQEKHTAHFVDPLDDDQHINVMQDQTYAFIRTCVPGPGRILDIGCCNARLLLRASRDGWTACGIELLQPLAEKASSITGIPIRACNFLEYEPEPGESYDVAVLRHVLEHLPDSLLAMNKIRGLLKNGGYAVLEFPNAGSPDMRFKWFLRRTGLHRHRFPEAYAPHHCNEFCRTSFEYLLKMTGFALIQWHTYSSKAGLSPLYDAIGYGNKARCLIRKCET